MKNTIYIQHYQSPCGELLLGSYEDRLCLCDWVIEKHHGRVVRRLQKTLHADYEETTSDILNETVRQLDEYFAGKRKNFTIPLLFVGTDFQKKVWNKLLEVPYGKTVSYGELARMIGMPKAVRAVARPMLTEPMPFPSLRLVIGLSAATIRLRDTAEVLPPRNCCWIWKLLTIIIFLTNDRTATIASGFGLPKTQTCYSPVGFVYNPKPLFFLVVTVLLIILLFVWCKISLRELPIQYSLAS